MQVIKTLRTAVQFYGESISNQEYLKGTHCKLKELENIHHYLYTKGLHYRAAKVYSKMVYNKIMNTINKGAVHYDSSVIPF